MFCILDIQDVRCQRQCRAGYAVTDLTVNITVSTVAMGVLVSSRGVLEKTWSTPAYVRIRHNKLINLYVYMFC